MKERKKRLDKMAVRFFYMLLVSFLVLYLSKSSGYYEFAEHKQVELNEKEIEKFENDIANGENVNLTDYIKEKDVKYNNLASDLGYSISYQISNIFTNGLDDTYGILGQFFSG